MSEFYNISDNKNSRNRYNTCVHVCLPDGVSHNTVQRSHLTRTGEAGQVGSQSLTKPLSFLPRAFPAEPLLMKHLTR